MNLYSETPCPGTPCLLCRNEYLSPNEEKHTLKWSEAIGRETDEVWLADQKQKEMDRTKVFVFFVEIDKWF